MIQKKRSVLITGVCTPWGGKLARLLENDPDFNIILGLDYKKPDFPLRKTEFFQVDLHNPLIAELIKTSEVDTVCHLQFMDAYSHSEEIFDLNVMGAQSLLAACAAGEVPRVLFMSDTKVYGGSSRNPCFLEETADFKGQYRHPYVRDRWEVEKLLAKFAREYPEIKTTILRFANILGPDVDTPMRRYLEAPAVPMVFGFDPMFQFTHEEDVVAALYHALKSEAHGVFNVAGQGAMPIGQVLRIGRRVPVPFGAPFLRMSNFFVQKTPVADYIPIETDFLKYTFVGDTTRMKEVLGFKPKYTSKQTVIDFFEHLRILGYIPKRGEIETAPEAHDQLQEYINSMRRINEAIQGLQ
ncbi:NAD-dependent epimerase/dehydratase family protein [Desulfatibacillum aliphaticivorans]|uniref:NAD-dependent epimerase/dehydratase family protein n=1 Tax=Desulfatibacillum aliphaticivorans TaxID=218208 RepID=UPI0004256ECD|nr:NAD-dependent epimerase/dehydratase family protein [Desulfatibacillum aliphaticivorans]